MAQIPASVSVPIVFSDGRREFDACGDVTLNPSWRFDTLRSAIALKIGLEPRQISIFLACRERPPEPGSPEIYCKVPIHAKSDLAAVARERNCFFYAVWKPPRRDRRRKPRGRRGADDADRVPTLIRRHPPPPPSPAAAAAGPGLGLGFMDYETKMRELQRQRENYYALNTDLFDGGHRAPTGEAAVACPECSQRPTPFHSCVYDTVTVAFRSRAGPVARPVK